MKKVYIQPLMKAYTVDSSDIICGSGDSKTTMGLGGPSSAPTADKDGIISTESKTAAFDIEDSDMDL